MPLSNLLLVFCPSLSMTPPLLKVLCEAEGIWGGVDDEEGEEEQGVDLVIDIRRQTMPARSPTSAGGGGGFFSDEPTLYTTMKEEEESESVRSGRASLDTTDNNPSSDYHASAEESIYDDGEYEMLGEVAPRRRARRDGNVERREEVPTVYLDCASSSVSSLGCQEDHAGPEVSMSMPYLQHSREAARDDDGSISSGNYSMHAPSPPPLLSSSSDSVATPISSGNPSFSHLPLEEHEQHQEKEERDQLSQPRIHAKDHQRHQGSGPEIIEVAPLELRLPPPQTQTQTSKRPVISNPIPIPLPVQFPTSTPPPSQQRPGGAAASLKRRSIPMLSLPNFSSAQPSASKKEKDSPSPSPSPLGSASSGSSGMGSENVKSLSNRSKKPSLKLLFSKKSASSLTGERDRSDSIGGGMPFISAPIPQPHPATMVSLSPEWSPKLQQHQHQGHQTPPPPPRSAASDSNSNSSSSSVSTPVSAVTAPQSQQASSMYSLPPVLDTPIEGASFGFDLAGFDMRLTPTPADGSSTITSTTTSASADALPPPLNNSRSQQPPVIHHHPLSMMHRNYIRPQASTSNLSISSTASSNHLSLFDDDDDDEGMEEWTQSVLLAADVEGVQKGP